ncbi:hypothetical protein G9A89_010671 [Geosiphon pyriformis]|nr:hypothetical protein G9A89_010671 [Geosiphon pyriformis]
MFETKIYKMCKEDKGHLAPIIANYSTHTSPPSVLDLYMFDTVSLGGGSLSNGYKILAELMNNAKILSTSNRFANQVQPISARFASNLETIQNALKYEKKLRYPSVLKFEKAEDVVISKQYEIKDAQNSKNQAVLLGVASKVISKLLYKYSDFLFLDFINCHNSLNFSNTVFMVRSDEPRG